MYVPAGMASTQVQPTRYNVFTSNWRSRGPLVKANSAIAKTISRLAVSAAWRVELREFIH